MELGVKVSKKLSVELCEASQGLLQRLSQTAQKIKYENRNRIA